YGLNSFLQKQKNDEKSHILLLKIAHIGYHFIFEALSSGHEIYQLSGNSIIKYSFFCERKYLNLDISKENSDERWKKTANKLDDNNIVTWINSEYGFKVSEIILPKLKYFVQNVCPDILKSFKFFINFYQKEKIDFVITPHKCSPCEFAAIAAANSVEGTKSVCIQHGNEAFVNKSWYNHEMKDYNIFICTDAEIKEHFHGICKQNNYPTDICCSSHRLQNVKKIRCIRNLQKTASKEKQRIIYLPTMFAGDTRMLERNFYPDTWYYKFTKTLIEYFSTQKKYTFVWKGLPISDAKYNPIPDFIKDNHFDNIEIATNPFTEHLLNADRVICDYPSTGFYESIVAGVPTMSLYHRSFELRKTALDYFGDILKPYSNVQEAIEKIGNFLNSNPELYISDIETKDKNIVEILDEINFLKKMERKKVNMAK
ncbi:MAG: hypothetical protein NT038_09665, partial [Euryarchaeota archaeon]|nr:hypothetical protein [Euryarchaeota archaeon]